MRRQGMFDPAQLVFMDGSWTNTSMVRLRGRCPRGERLIGYAPLGHWKTITFVAGLRVRAMVAPFVVEGAMNGPMFLAYVKQCLAMEIGKELAAGMNLEKAPSQILGRAVRSLTAPR